MPTKIDYDTLKEFYIYPNGDMRRYFAQFCAESNVRLIDYCVNKPKIALPLIRNYINEIQILFQCIGGGTAKIILKNAPDLLDPNPNSKNPNNQNNLHKFFDIQYTSFNQYTILSNLETTPEEKMNQLDSLPRPYIRAETDRIALF